MRLVRQRGSLRSVSITTSATSRGDSFQDFSAAGFPPNHGVHTPGHDVGNPNVIVTNFLHQGFTERRESKFRGTVGGPPRGKHFSRPGSQY